MVHKTAIVSDNIKIGKNVSIGPYSVIEDEVSIGENTIIGNHVTISTGTHIGSNCSILHSASIGAIPQDLKFNNEITNTYIGDNTTIREFVTINRGTEASKKTSIGSNCLLMAYVHIAHDCVVGDNAILSNMTTLGGHVTLGDWVSLAGGVMVHQFCNIGDHSFVGAGYWAVQDVPPYILAVGMPLKFGGINSVGLKRRGFSIDDRKLIKSMYKKYFRSNLNRNKIITEFKNEYSNSEVASKIITFIESTSRGVI